MRIEKYEKSEGVWWIRVVFADPKKPWIPSFEDLFRIVHGIVWCERQKYTWVQRPSDLVRKALNRFVDESDRHNFPLDGDEFERVWVRICADTGLPWR